MALQYIVEYKSLRNNDIRVEISDDNYTGSPISLDSSQGDAVKLVSDSSDNPFDSHIVKRSIELSVFSGGIDIDEIVGINDGDKTIRYYKNNELQFQGFVIADGLQEKETGVNYIVNIKGVDGLSMLETEEISYVNSSKKRPIDIVGAILTGSGYTNNELPIRWACSLKNKKYPNEDFFAGETKLDFRGEATAYYILENILKSAGCWLEMIGGYWYIISFKDFIKSEGSLTFNQIVMQTGNITSVGNINLKHSNTSDNFINDDGYYLTTKKIGTAEISYEDTRFENVLPDLNKDWVTEGTVTVEEGVPINIRNEGHSALLKNDGSGSNISYFKLDSGLTIDTNILFKHFEWGFTFSPRTGFTIAEDSEDKIEWTANDVIEIAVQFRGLNENGNPTNLYLNEFGYWSEGLTNIRATPQQHIGTSIEVLFAGETVATTGRVATGDTFRFETFGASQREFEYSPPKGLLVPEMVQWLSSKINQEEGVSASYQNNSGYSVLTISGGALLLVGKAEYSNDGSSQEYIPFKVDGMRLLDVATVRFQSKTNEGRPLLPDIGTINENLPSGMGKLYFKVRVREDKVFMLDDFYMFVDDHNDVYEVTNETKNSTENQVLGISSSFSGFMESSYGSSWRDRAENMWFTDGDFSGTLTEIYGAFLVAWKRKSLKQFNGSVNGDLTGYKMAVIHGKRHIILSCSYNADTNISSVKTILADSLDYANIKSGVPNAGNSVNKSGVSNGGSPRGIGGDCECPERLSDLNDVDNNLNPIGGDALVYDEVSGKWIAGEAKQDLQSVTEVGNETTLPLISRGTVNKEFLGIPLSAPQQEDIVNGQGYAWLGSGVSAENPSNKLVSLDDVSITNPLDGQAVVWDASIGKFVAGSSGTSSTLDDVAKNGNITSVKLVGSTVFTLSNDGDYVQREHLHSSGWSLQLDGTKVHLRDFDGFSISEIDISGLLTGDLSVTVDDTDPNNPELVFEQDGVEVGRVPASALLAGVVRSGVMQDGVLIFRDNTNATVFSIDINSIASNSTITLNANGSLSGGGAFTLNQSSNKTIGFDLSSSAKSDISKGVEAYGWGEPTLQNVAIKGNITDRSLVIDSTISTSYFYRVYRVDTNGGFNRHVTRLIVLDDEGDEIYSPLTMSVYGGSREVQYYHLGVGSYNSHYRIRLFDGANPQVGNNVIWHEGNLRSNSENDSRYVRLTTDQTIQDSKNFTGELRIPTTAGTNNNSIWLSGGVTAEQPTDFVLPIASASVLGGIKVGANLQISNDGVLSATGSGDGSVTSVGLSAPTGFSVSGSPVTSSGVLALSFASGYSLPTTAKQGQWDTAYSQRHTHSNKSVLDGITSGKVSEWDEAYSNSYTRAKGISYPYTSENNPDIIDGGHVSNYGTRNWLENGPFSGYGGLIAFRMSGTSTAGVEFVYDVGREKTAQEGGRLAFRTSAGGGDTVSEYKSWKEIYHSGNLRSNAQNDSRYLQQTNFTWSNLSGKPTTLSGYGITDAVPNSRQVIAGDGLTGGGNLTANRTIALSSSTQSDISKGVTAHGWGNHSDAGYWNITKNTGYLFVEGDDLNNSVQGDRGLSNVLPNQPIATGWQDIVNISQYGSDDFLQLGLPFRGDDRFYFRNKSSGGWSEWRRIYHSGNLRSNSENDGRYVQQTRVISAGDGLTGGGNLTANRTFSVDGTVVRTSGNQTIKGIKEFEDQLVIPTSAPANPINGAIWLGDGITAENI